MNVTISEWTWLNDHDICSMDHLAEASGLSSDELNALIESGAIVAVDATAEPRQYQMRCVVTATVARRLRDDFELDQNGMALAMTLMRRIEALEAELTAARALAART